MVVNTPQDIIKWLFDHHTDDEEQAINRFFEELPMGILPEKDTIQDKTDVSTSKDSEKITTTITAILNLIKRDKTSNSGQDTSGDTDEDTDEKNDEDTGEDTGEDMDEDTSGDTGEDMDEDTSGDTGEDMDEDTSGDTGEDMDEDTGDDAGKDIDKTKLEKITGIVTAILGSSHLKKNNPPHKSLKGLVRQIQMASNTGGIPKIGMEGTYSGETYTQYRDTDWYEYKGSEEYETYFVNKEGTKSQKDPPGTTLSGFEMKYDLDGRGYWQSETEPDKRYWSVWQYQNNQLATNVRVDPVQETVAALITILSLNKKRAIQRRKETEQRQREEDERKNMEEEERRIREAEEAEQRAKEEAERRATEEAERRAKEEAERRAKEEAEQRAKEEAEKKAKEEAERRAKEEAEKKAKEEAERKAKEEAERRAKEEAEKKAKEEAERRAKEEAKKRVKTPAEMREEWSILAGEEAVRKAKEEAKKKATEESDDLVVEDLEEDSVIRYSPQQIRKKDREERIKIAEESKDKFNKKYEEMRGLISDLLTKSKKFKSDREIKNKIDILRGKLKILYNNVIGVKSSFATRGVTKEDKEFVDKADKIRESLIVKKGTIDTNINKMTKEALGEIVEKTQKKGVKIQEGSLTKKQKEDKLKQIILKGSTLIDTIYSIFASTKELIRIPKHKIIPDKESLYYKIGTDRIMRIYNQTKKKGKGRVAKRTLKNKRGYRLV